MNIKIDNVVETKSAITARVKSSNKILGTHRYNKSLSQHSFTEGEHSFTDDEVSEIFNQSRELIKCHLT